MNEYPRLTEAQRELLRKPDARTRAYYYSPDPTGEVTVDIILSAVAWAGKLSHNTGYWSENIGPDRFDYGPFLAGRDQSPADVIDAAAHDAAAEIAGLRERISMLEKQIGEKR